MARRELSLSDCQRSQLGSAFPSPRRRTSLKGSRRTEQRSSSRPGLFVTLTGTLMCPVPAKGGAAQEKAWAHRPGALRRRGSKDRRELPLPLHRLGAQGFRAPGFSDEALTAELHRDIQGERGVSAVSGKPLSYKGSRLGPRSACCNVDSRWKAGDFKPRFHKIIPGKIIQGPSLLLI